jgi:hypothetical protein
MKRIIVTTTIHGPTEAIRDFDRMPGWELIVVGDLKTPTPYQLERGRYFSPEEQQAYDSSLSDAIGWNCIQRRNFGFLLAYEMGADIVATVDDDNIPLAGWGQDLAVGREIEIDVYETTLPVFDPIGATNYSHLWHRGFPPQLLAQRNYKHKNRRLVRADVQAAFWNGDPDVDAICRMVYQPRCTFEPRCFPFAANRPAAFNSQNTFLRRRMLRDYFLFPFIGRMDDIWAGYYLQALGHRVLFSAATVFQQRNAHDATKDLEEEWLGYQKTLPLLYDLAINPDLIRRYLPNRATHAFEIYQRHF